MSVKVLPPESPRIPPAPEEEPDRSSGDWQKLRDAVAGGSTTMVRVRAIGQLVGSHHPAAHRDLEKILKNPAEPARLRALAALSLARLPSREVASILIDALAERDQQVLTAILRALGRVGDERAVRALAETKHATGVADYQARFAAALISHRLGLDGSDLPEPEGLLQELPPAAARAFQLTRLSGADADYAIRTLSRETFGIEYDEERLYDIRCGANRWLLALNRDVARADGVSRLRSRKAFPAIIASWQSENRAYSARFLVLTAPNGAGRLRIHVHRLTGEPAFFGSGEITDSVVTFAVRALDAPGAFPLLMEGRYLEDGRLELKTALSALFVRRLRTPQRDGGGAGPRGLA